MDIKKKENIYLDKTKPRNNTKEYILRRNNNLENDFISCNHKIKRKIIYIYSKNKYFYHVNSVILIFLQFFMFFQIYSIKAMKIKALAFNYEITIKINGNGTQNILVGGEVPSRIYLNDNSTALAGAKIINDLELETNTVRMEWDSPFNNFHSMFNGLSNIIEIDFSNFNSYQVEDMADMFHGCFSLVSINFNNFNTQSVTDMADMFYECYNLKSLDLSSFNTSSVTSLSQMFFNCYNLEYINFSSFDTKSVTSMSQMFLNCYNLKSLDLSRFNTSSVTSMFQMFLNCQNLKILNLTNFDTKKVENMEAMFFGCHRLETLDLSSFDTSSVNNMNQMFLECKALKSLNLSNFNTSLLTQASDMFRECRQLENLDISNFQTSQITNMDHMFYGCNSFKSLNLSHFDTSKVTSFQNMFGWCNSLEALDISNFDTSSAEILNNMFMYCQKLASLDLTHFDTSKVKDTNHMFDNCISLVSLELGNFDTSSVTNMGYMFNGCQSLISLNLNSFTSSESLTSFEGMFNGVKTTLKFCINNIISEVIKSQLSSYSQLNCSDLCSEFLQSKYIPGKNKCIIKCINDDTFNIEYKNECFISCPNGTHPINSYLCEKDLLCDNYYNYNRTGCLDEIPLGYYLNNTIEQTIDKCKIKCSNCTKESMDADLCISCNNDQGYYQKENDELNENSFFDCYKGEQLGYYLNEEEKKYKTCYTICRSCSGRGDNEHHNCSECFSDLILNSNGNCESPVEEDTTTYADTESNQENNPDTTIVNEETNPDTTIINEETNPDTTIVNEETNPDTTIVNEETNEIDSSENNLQDTKEINHPSSNIITESDELSNTITNIYSNNIINVSEVSNKSINSYKIDLNSNKSKQNYKNVTFIEFSPEEIEFFYNKFNLDKEKDIIYAIVSDYINDDPGMATRDYNFRLFLENGTELNLSTINEDIYLDFYVPIDDLNSTHFNDAKELKSQGYDIYDINSDFYNDFCSPAFLGENDITLKDRRKYIYPNNVSLCKENCKYNGIDLEDERIICSCNLNANKSYEDEEDNNFVEEDGNFLSYFLDNINYNVFKCYNLISSYENLKNNYAFWTILAVYLVLIIINLIFYFYSIPLMKKSMIEEIPTSEKIKKEVAQKLLSFRSIKENNCSAKKENNLLNPTKKKGKTKINKSNMKLNTASLFSPKKRKKKRKKNKSCIKLNTNGFAPYKENQRKETTKINKKKKRFKTTNKLTNRIEDTQTPSLELLIKKNEGGILKYDKNKSYSNEELNELSYNQAIILDKRNILKIWGSLLITKIEVINLFCTSSTIKIILIGEYILSLLINFFFNTLLYSDEVVSQKYHNNGELDVIVTLVLSILSNIITSIICFYLNYSKGLEDRANLIKEIKIKKYYIQNVNTFFKYIKLKFICFFLSEMVAIACCYYYIVIFCIIYSNSKESLMVNYLTSLVEGLITSVAISILILVTRKIGLSCLNKHFYNISKYINTRF